MGDDDNSKDNEMKSYIGGDVVQHAPAAPTSIDWANEYVALIEFKAKLREKLASTGNNAEYSQALADAVEALTNLQRFW